MKIKTLIHKYDPQARILETFDGDALKGSLKGDFAEEQFLKLMMTGKEVIFTDMNSELIAEHARKVRRLRAIWNKLGIDEHREAILEQNYGLKSTSQLNMKQLDEMIEFYSNDTTVNPEVRALRSEILTILQKMDIYQTSDDWSKVNRFFMDKRVAGKLMYKMTLQELSDIIPKLHSILDKYQKKQRELKRQAQMN